METKTKAAKFEATLNSGDEEAWNLLLEEEGLLDEDWTRSCEEIANHLGLEESQVSDWFERHRDQGSVTLLDSGRETWMA